MLTCKAIMSAFGILMPTACYLGFSPVNDITRPLATNVIISDGQFFKFASYQLNKTELVDANANVQVSTFDISRLVSISLYAEMAHGLQLAGFPLLDLTKNIKNENTIIGIAILKEFFIRFPN